MKQTWNFLLFACSIVAASLPSIALAQTAKKPNVRMAGSFNLDRVMEAVTSGSKQ